MIRFHLWSGSVLYLDNIQSHMCKFNVVAGFPLSEAKTVSMNIDTKDCTRSPTQDLWICGPRCGTHQNTPFLAMPPTRRRICDPLTRVLQCSNKSGSSAKSHDHVRKNRTINPPPTRSYQPTSHKNNSIKVSSQDTEHADALTGKLKLENLLETEDVHNAAAAMLQTEITHHVDDQVIPALKIILLLLNYHLRFVWEA